MIERYPFADTKLNKVLFGLFLLAQLYLTRDSMPNTTFMGFYQCQYLAIAMMLWLGGTLLIFNWESRKKILTDGRMLLVVFFGVVMLLPMVIKRDWQLMYISVLIAACFGILMSYVQSTRQAAKYYVVLMTALGAYSLLAHYGLRPLGEAGTIKFYTVVNGFGAEFYNCGLSFPTLLIYTKNRNYGLFREPGVYQYFLLLALYLNNYRVDWQKCRSCWIANGILAVTMLSTQATGGVIEMALLAAVIYMDKKWYRSFTGQVAVLTTIIVGAGLVAILGLTKPPIYFQITGMFAKLTSGEDSVVDRVGSIAMNMKAFLTHPLFGGKLSEVLYAVDNNTSSTTILLAMMGILGGSAHVIACAALVWDKERFVLWNLALLVILMMSFNTQNLITNPFLWLFPMMALVERTVPQLNRGIAKWTKNC